MWATGGVLWATLGVQGVPWRRPREVFSTEWSPEGPRERFCTILAQFCMEFWSKFGDSWSNFGSFSHNVHWIFNGFCENVRGNRERKAETELGQFTSCLMRCSHQCPTGRGGLSEAITMTLNGIKWRQKDVKFL